MVERERKRGILMDLAVEAVIPIIGGCTGALIAGTNGGIVGVAMAEVVEKAITFFGPPIVGRWVEWLRSQSPATRQAALTDLADLPPEEARREAEAAVERLAPETSPEEDRSLAIAYLAAIPQSVQRSLVPNRATGMRAPPTVVDADPRALLRLLPWDVPPYPAPGPLPGSEYRLEELVGSGGFGAVYRGSTPTLQYLPVAIKFCLDASLLPALRQERANLERLMEAGGQAWSSRVVRLYGYNLDHPTPYLVYEYVPGGNVAQWLTARQAAGGPSHGEVFGVIVQVAEALAFAHARGLVHRDLKPANVLFDGGAVKLADFGIGGIVAEQHARPGLSTPTRSMTVAEQVSMYRGAGTPLYMSVEQRRGEAPDPRHDLYSLGVMWYQLLVGDVTRELHAGWARELETKFAVPREQIELIQRCVGWVEDRPRPPAGQLLEVLQPLHGAKIGTEAPPSPPTPAGGEASERYRHVLLLTRLKQLLACHRAVFWTRQYWITLVQATVLGLGLGMPVGSCAGEVTHEGLRPRNYSSSNQTAYYERADLATNVAVFVGVAVGLGVFGLVSWTRYRLWRRAQSETAKALSAKLDELQAEFPAEYRTWGGRVALTEPEIAEEVVRELEASRGAARAADGR